MVASHSELFQKSTADEGKILKLVKNRFLPNHEVLQWRPTKGEESLVVLSSFFQCEFGLPSCKFLHDLLHHYQIELVHVNPNSILQIVVFVHLCEAFLVVPPNFPLFKSYFFLKYQPSADNWKIIGSIGLHTRPHNSFLDLPLKTSLKG
jgi:hypothetical protein